MKLYYTDRAKDDLESGFLWYEKQRKGLGFDFLDCVESAARLILKNPEMYAVHYTIFRSCTIRRFPFSVFYTVSDTRITIHAVFDNRQAPEKRP